MFFSEPEVIILDTEYTSWEGAQERKWGNPGEYREIVQIGAVRISSDTLTELDARQWFVKPVKNPILSDFFMELTHISQEVVDQQGMKYADALNELAQWVGSRKIYSWGGDGKVMWANAELIEIPFPFAPDQYIDIRSIFKDRGIETEKYMSSTIPRAFGLEPPPNAHDALSDSRSIVIGLRALRARV